MATATTEKTSEVQATVFHARCADIVTGLIEGATLEETKEALYEYVLGCLRKPTTASLLGEVTARESALVAAAYEAVAFELETGERGDIYALVARACTPVDARAAFDRLLQAAREDGAEEAGRGCVACEIGSNGSGALDPGHSGGWDCEVHRATMLAEAREKGRSEALKREEDRATGGAEGAEVMDREALGRRLFALQREAYGDATHGWTDICDLDREIYRRMGETIAREMGEVIAREVAEECAKLCVSRIPQEVLARMRRDPSAQIDQRTAFEMGERIRAHFVKKESK